MLILTRPVHSSLRCFVDPKGDVNTNRFIADQLAQRVTTEECTDFACRDIVGEPCHRNVWSCPNWLVDELLTNRRTSRLNFDLYVREQQSSEPPHFAVSIEDGQSPEDALRAVLDDIAIQVLPGNFSLTEAPLKPGDFAILIPSTRPSHHGSSPRSMRHSQPGVPPRWRRDRRKW